MKERNYVLLLFFVFGFTAIIGISGSFIFGDFKRFASSQEQSFNKSIQKNLDLVQSLGAFLQIVPSPTKFEFEQFSTNILRQNISLQALKLIPLVPKTNRLNFEREMQNKGFKNFKIHSSSPHHSQQFQPDFYLPVAHIYPLLGSLNGKQIDNRKALGLDLVSNKPKRKAALLARDLGQIVATKSIKLGQETGVQRGLLLFYPIFDVAQKQPPKNLEERRARLQAFALAVLRIGDLFEHSLAENKALYSLSIHLVEQTNLGQQTLYVAGQQSGFYSIKKTIHVAGRSWEIQYFLNLDFIISRWQALVFLLFALSFHSILTLFLWKNLKQSKKIEEALSKAEKMARFAELNPAPVLRFNHKGEVLKANPAAQKAFLLGDLEGTHYSKWISLHQKDFDSALQKGSIIYHEMAVGEEFYVFTFRGVPEYNVVHAYGNNITLSKLAEEKSQQKEYAATMWQIASGVGHEIGNSLLAVTGFKSRLGKLLQKSQELVPTETFSKCTSLLEKMGNEIIRAQNITNALSGLARKAPEKAIFRVKPLLQNIIDAIRWNEKEIEFMLEADDPEVTGFADVDSFRQIIINLIKNAVYATKEQGERRILLTITTSQNLHILITDNGSGIPLEVQTKIFKNLFSTKPQGEGTGIGLSLCRKLAEENGGSLVLHKSTEHIGTSFKLTLPLGEP